VVGVCQHPKRKQILLLLVAAPPRNDKQASPKGGKVRQRGNGRRGGVGASQQSLHRKGKACGARENCTERRGPPNAKTVVPCMPPSSRLMSPGDNMASGPFPKAVAPGMPSSCNCICAPAAGRKKQRKGREWCGNETLNMLLYWGEPSDQSGRGRAKGATNPYRRMGH